jgi:hypothetical protein
MKFVPRGNHNQCLFSISADCRCKLRYYLPPKTFPLFLIKQQNNNDDEEQQQWRPPTINLGSTSQS